MRRSQAADFVGRKCWCTRVLRSLAFAFALRVNVACISIHAWTNQALVFARMARRWLLGKLAVSLFTQRWSNFRGFPRERRQGKITEFTNTLAGVNPFSTEFNCWIDRSPVYAKAIYRQLIEDCAASTDDTNDEWIIINSAVYVDVLKWTHEFRCER